MSVIVVVIVKNNVTEKKNRKHKKLNPSRLQLWAHKIINKETTYDIPPSYPVFYMKSSVFINKNNSATQMQNSQTFNTPSPIFIQLPNQVYQNLINTHLELPSSSKLPSIGEFLNNLDLKYNCNNVQWPAKVTDNLKINKI
ncbi:hypothetical protein RhiirC2_761170, partial [Rhizophagus irregularis]